MRPAYRLAVATNQPFSTSMARLDSAVCAHSNSKVRHQQEFARCHRISPCCCNLYCCRRSPAPPRRAGTTSRVGKGILRLRRRRHYPDLRRTGGSLLGLRSRARRNTLQPRIDVQGIQRTRRARHRHRERRVPGAALELEHGRAARMERPANSGMDGPAYSPLTAASIRGDQCGSKGCRRLNGESASPPCAPPSCRSIRSAVAVRSPARSWSSHPISSEWAWCGRTPSMALLGAGCDTLAGAALSVHKMALVPDPPTWTATNAS